MKYVAIVSCFQAICVPKAKSCIYIVSAARLEMTSLQPADIKLLKSGLQIVPVNNPDIDDVAIAACMCVVAIAVHLCSLLTQQSRSLLTRHCSQPLASTCC